VRTSNTSTPGHWVTATRLPSGLSEASEIPQSRWLSGVAASLPVRTSQKRTVESMLAVAISLPSALNDGVQTAPR
jgi:hypothetical protein